MRSASYNYATHEHAKVKAVAGGATPLPSALHAHLGILD